MRTFFSATILACGLIAAGLPIIAQAQPAPGYGPPPRHRHFRHHPHFRRPPPPPPYRGRELGPR